MLNAAQGYGGVLDALGPSGVLAIIRGVAAERLVDTVRVLAHAGVTAMEVTLDTPGALDRLGDCREVLGSRAVLGAGTVLDEQTAVDAIAAGAQFLVSPHTEAAVIAAAREAGVDVLPGALTPTEILAAFRLGATAVKVFPVSAVGGVSYIKAIREPLDDVPLIPVGGISVDEVRDYLNVGAIGVGLGSSLVDRVLANQGRYDEIAARARSLVAA